MLCFLAHNIINSSIFVSWNIRQSSGIYATNFFPDSCLKIFNRLYSFRMYLIFHITPEEEIKRCQIRRPWRPVNRFPVNPIIANFSWQVFFYSISSVRRNTVLLENWRSRQLLLVLEPIVPKDRFVCCAINRRSVKEIRPWYISLMHCVPDLNFSILIGTYSTACWFSVPQIRALCWFTVPLVWKTHSSEKAILERYWESLLISLRQCRAQFSLPT